MNKCSDVKYCLLLSLVFVGVVTFKWLLLDLRVGDPLPLGVALLMAACLGWTRQNFSSRLILSVAAIVLALISEHTVGGNTFGASTSRLLLLGWNPLYQSIVRYFTAICTVFYVGKVWKSRNPPSWLEYAVRPANFTGRLLLMCLAAFLTYTMTSQGIWHGRFWAEEGSIYFKQAWEMPVGQYLFYVSPPQGYYGIVTNVAALLAVHLVPLESAPHVTTGIGLLVQLIPVWLIVYSSETDFPKLWRRAAAAFAVILVQPTAEIWGTTTNSQFWLTAAVAFILTTDPRSELTRRYRLAVLALCGLSGVICCLLLPFFFVAAFWDKSKRRFQELFVYCAVTAVQVTVVLDQGGRENVKDLLLFPNFAFLKGFIRPLFDNYTANAFLRIFSGLGLTGTAWGAAISLLPFVLAAIALAFFGRKRAMALLFLSVFVSFFSFVKAAGTPDYATLMVALKSEANRYFYAPNVMLAVACCFHPRQLPRFWAPQKWVAKYQAVCVVIIGLALATGLTTTVNLQSGPPWNVQVEKWRHDPDYVMRIWPPGWYLKIRPNHTPVDQPPRNSLTD